MRRDRVRVFPALFRGRELLQNREKDNRRKGFFAKQMVQCSILLNGWLNEDVELNDGQDEKIKN